MTKTAAPPQIQFDQFADPYAVAREIEARLKQDVGSRELRIAGAVAFGQLGLAAHAARLLRHDCVDSVTRGLIEAQLPREQRRIAWSGLRQRFLENLPAFDCRTGLADRIESAWRENVSRLQLFEARDGTTLVYGRDAGGGEWLPALAPPPGLDEAALRSRWQSHIIRPLVIRGIGHGHGTLSVAAASRHTFLTFSAPLLIVEPSPLAWAVALHLHDWRDVLDDPRVHLICGADCLHMLRAALESRDGESALVIDGGAAWPGLPSARAFQEVVDMAAARRETARREAFEQVDRQTAARFEDAVKRIAAARAGEPIRVLGMTSRFTTVLQHTLRDLLAAFEAAGHTARLVIETDDSSYFSPLALMGEIERFQPDLLIAIDHLRAEYARMIPRTLPMAVWIQDALPNLFCSQAGESIDANQFVFGVGFSPLTRQFGYPAERFLPCITPPRACNDSADEREDYHCDVMYMSNVAQTPAALHEEFCDRHDAPFRKAADSLFEAVNNLCDSGVVGGGFSPISLVDSLFPALRDSPEQSAARQALADHARSLLDRHMRQMVVADLADWADSRGKRLHLYGRGWTADPRWSRYARGVVGPGSDMQSAWRSAGVCIHAGLNSALHQRVLDGVSAGAFFLIQESVWESRSSVSEALLEFAERHIATLPVFVTPADLPGALRADATQFMRRVSMDERGLWLTSEIFDNLRLSIRDERPPLPARLWTDFSRIVFHGRDQLWQRLDWATEHPTERRAIAARMREQLGDRLSYSRLVHDIISLVADGLRSRK
ncbi:MAG: hypothetical protein JNG88_08770 [Phycisphaerales bacterium]|nr:hypothetical protein [Phycisphaerales bacterium]